MLGRTLSPELAARLVSGGSRLDEARDISRYLVGLLKKTWVQTQVEHVKPKLVHGARGVRRRARAWPNFSVPQLPTQLPRLPLRVPLLTHAKPRRGGPY